MLTLCYLNSDIIYSALPQPCFLNYSKLSSVFSVLLSALYKLLRQHQIISHIPDIKFYFAYTAFVSIVCQEIILGTKVKQPSSLRIKQAQPFIILLCLDSECEQCTDFNNSITLTADEFHYFFAISYFLTNQAVNKRGMGKWNLHLWNRVPACTSR